MLKIFQEHLYSNRLSKLNLKRSEWKEAILTLMNVNVKLWTNPRRLIRFFAFLSHV